MSYQGQDEVWGDAEKNAFRVLSDAADRGTVEIQNSNGSFFVVCRGHKSDSIEGEGRTFLEAVEDAAHKIRRSK